MFDYFRAIRDLCTNINFILLALSKSSPLIVAISVWKL
jgi:hypothetical protein